MSAIGDKDLVRVRSHDELRAGMTVVRKTCHTCGGRHTSVLLRSVQPGMFQVHGFGDDWESCSAPMGWVESPVYHGDPDTAACFCDCIREGRLYRLRDLDDSKADSVVTRRPVATPVKT